MTAARQKERERAAVLVDLFLEQGWSVPDGVEHLYGLNVWFIAYKNPNPRERNRYAAEIIVQDDGGIHVTGFFSLGFGSEAAQLEAEKVLRAAGLGEWIR